MLVHLKILLARLRESLWFIPTVIAVLAFATALVLEHLDLQHIDEQNYIFGIGFTDAAGARTILTAIASASITVAGVVFSITMAVLASASSQYGPRLLRNFLAERSTKIVLGLFIGTFVYCITVALTINAEKTASWIPQYSVAGGCILGLTSFAALIFFIHRVATFIQASKIIDDVVSTLESHLNLLFPNNAVHNASSESTPPGATFSPAEFNASAMRVESSRNGYVQALKLDELLNYTTKNNICVRFRCRPGKPVIPGQVIAEYWHKDSKEASTEFLEKTRDQILRSMIIGCARTPDQDAEFAIDQLVEIAVRALSPGINDPFTAISCIDRLVGALARISDKPLPSGLIHDSNDDLRIVVQAYTHDGLCDAAFHRLRQHGISETSVALGLLEAMLRLRELSDLDSKFLRALERHLSLLRDDFRARKSLHASDLQDFDQRLEDANFPLQN